MLPVEAARFITNPDYFAVIVFVSPRSPQWPFVWALCQKAEGVAEGKDYFIAAFLLKEYSVRILTSICHITQEWKTAHLFVRQREIGHIYSIRWLDCYFKSLKCADHNAWCLDLTKGPEKLFLPGDYTITINLESDALAEKKHEKTKYYICPCRQLSSYNWGRIEIPINLKDQFQAFAVERGMADCPNFDINNFKPVDETENI